MIDFWNEKKKRKPISISRQKELLLKSKGKCQLCRTDVTKGIKVHIHHKDGNPSNNKISNLIVLCPNCHSKQHEYKKVRKKDMLGGSYTVKKLVTKNIKKPGPKPKTKRKVVGHDPWTGKPKYRTVKTNTNNTSNKKRKEIRRRAKTPGISLYG